MRLRKKGLALIGAGAMLVGVGAGAFVPALRNAHTIHPKTGRSIVIPGKEGDATVLFNGWRITPAGRAIPTGDMLQGGAISPDRKTLAIANCGYNAHHLHLIDLATEKEIANLDIKRAANGIAWTKDSKRLYVSGGIASFVNDVSIVQVGAEGTWEQAKGFKLPQRSPDTTKITGLALSSDEKILYTLNEYDGKLYALDTTDGKVVASLSVGEHPFACKMTPGNTLYIANLGGSEVVAVQRDPVKGLEILAHLPTAEHPNDLALTTDGRLFVSCGNADAVSVIDLKTGKPVETIKTTLTPKSPAGSTPNAVAVSPDNKTLYIANADGNNVCVVDISRHGKSQVRGFLPTGWYPTAVLVSPDGKRVIIGSGKGMGTGPNDLTGNRNPEAPSGFKHHGNKLTGLVSFVDVPNEAKLREYTAQVMSNTPGVIEKSAQLQEKTAIPVRLGDRSPIKHILYIIKENRTYDQVFGDIKQGNGDPSLTLFGADVTPNHHALAEQFVLLDNLYCSGEVSQDGHPWSTSAIATDFTQRSWVLSYSGKGKTVGDGKEEDPRSGYLWQACERKGLSYRAYGEYAEHPTLKGHINEEFIGKGKPGVAPPGRDMDKADIFIAEFKEFEKKNAIPSFMIMSLGEDHTNGTSPGAYTPKAMVASNDQAIGKIVEAISHSGAWKDTAIFIIEDDAQNGPDHIDSHRTVGLVVSAYTKRNYVDSTMYSTASMLRSMELILGLPPLTQYDAGATPMIASFTNRADLTPYALIPPKIDLTVKNKASAFGAQLSATMDFSDYDRADEEALNRILWHSIKGVTAPYPAPVRSAQIAQNGRAESPQSRDTDD